MVDQTNDGEQRTGLGRAINAIGLDVRSVAVQFFFTLLFGIIFSSVSLAIVIATWKFILTSFDGIAWLYQQNGKVFVVTAIAIVLAICVILQRGGWILPNGVGRWVRAVGKVAGRPPKNGSGLKMARSFARTYAKEEAEHIRGRHHRSKTQRLLAVFARLYWRPADNSNLPGPRVYTSFVSYSAIVRSVVKSAVKAASWNLLKKEEVICFTTLKMPLSQWFNNKTDTGTPFLYVGTDKEWCEYLEFMYEIAHSKKGFAGKVKIFRVIYAFSGQEKQYTIAPQDAMRRMCQARILVPAANNDEAGGVWIPPYGRPEIASIIASVNDAPLKQYITECYGAKDASYVIVANDIEVAAIPNYVWRRVVDVFEDLFSPPEFVSSSAYIHLIDDSRFRHFFRGPSGTPEDSFLVGTRDTKDHGTVSWKFCLAATTDLNSQMVRLEFSKLAGQVPPRVEKIVSRADEMWEVISGNNRSPNLLPLKEWVGA